jgi:hypothetical protein
MASEDTVQRLMGLAREATQEEIIAGLAMGSKGYRPERFNVAGKWERLESAIREALLPAGWRQIEEAPREHGKLLLGWVWYTKHDEDDDGYVTERQCGTVDFIEWRDGGEHGDGYWDAVSGPWGDSADGISHYMPLPAAPSATTAPAEAPADARMLDWLATAGTVLISLVVDAPHDGEICVSGDEATGYGSDLRAAIRAAMSAPTPQEPKP